MTISRIKKRPDDNIIRMSKRHKEPPVTNNDDFYGKNNYHMGNKLVNSNSNIGAINRVDVMPSSNEINSRKQTA